MPHCSYWKSRCGIKKVSRVYIDSALPWGGAGKGPSTLFSAFCPFFFVLFLRISTVSLLSVSLRADSNQDIGITHWLKIASPLGEFWTAPGMWAISGHCCETCTEVQFWFPCSHSYTFEALVAIPASFGASFPCSSPSSIIAQQCHVLKHHQSGSLRQHRERGKKRNVYDLCQSSKQLLSLQLIKH